MGRNRRGSCRRVGTQRARPRGEAVMSAGLINRPAISNGMLSWSCSHGEPPASVLAHHSVCVCVCLCVSVCVCARASAVFVCMKDGVGGPRQPYLFHSRISFTNNLKTAWEHPLPHPPPSIPNSSRRWKTCAFLDCSFRCSGNQANVKSNTMGINQNLSTKINLRNGEESTSPLEFRELTQCKFCVPCIFFFWSTIIFSSTTITRFKRITANYGTMKTLVF